MTTSPDKKITCAVVGLKQGLETVYVLRNHPAFDLKVVCDIDPEPFGWMTGKIDPTTSSLDWLKFPRVKVLMSELQKIPDIGKLEMIADYQALLRRADIDAVFIFTPDALHEEFTIAALRAGKYVLCTKPMALSLESAERIAKVAGEFPGHYMLGFQFIYSPFARAVMKEIDSGALGKVRQMSFHYHRGPFRPIYRSKATSGGSIIQESCHWFDLFRLFNGQSKFTKVAAFGGNDVHTAIQDIDDNGVVIIEYENRVRAALLYSYFKPKKNAEFFTLNGETGQLRGSFDHLVVENESGVRTLEVAGNRKLPGLLHEGYYEMHDEFAAMIQQKRESYSDAECGLENVLLSEVAQRALDGGALIERQPN